MDLSCTTSLQILANYRIFLLGRHFLKVLLSFEKHYNLQKRIINIFKDKKFRSQKSVSVELSQRVFSL